MRVMQDECRPRALGGSARGIGSSHFSFGTCGTRGMAIPYVPYCTTLFGTVRYCSVLYGTVLYCTVLFDTVLYCTVRYGLYDTVHTTSFNTEG